MPWYEDYERAYERGAEMHIGHTHAGEAGRCEYCAQVHAVRLAALAAAPVSAMAGGGVQ